MLSLRFWRDEAESEAAALLRDAVSSPSDDGAERFQIVERATAAGIWHVGPAALPIPLLSL